jgi:hypothetical protein
MLLNDRQDLREAGNPLSAIYLSLATHLFAIFSLVVTITTE